MSEQVADEPVKRRNTLVDSLDVTMTMSIITSADYIGEEGDIAPKLIRICAPLIGLVLSKVIVYFIKDYEDNKDEQRIEGYISKLQSQMEISRIAPTRKNALKNEQSMHQEDLMEIRRKRTKRRMF